MNASAPNRVPAGVPTGGQFAASAKAEAAVTLSVIEEPAAASLGDCPDCGAPMIGHLRDGRYLPGSQCRECHHTAAPMVHDGYFDHDGSNTPVTYTLMEDASIRVTTEDGIEWATYRPEDGVYSDALSVFDLTPEQTSWAKAERDDPSEALGLICQEADLPDTIGLYEIMLDRDRVPTAHLLSKTPSDVVEHHETYLSPAIDRLASDYAAGVDRNDPDTWPTDADIALVERACNDAGYPSMQHLYAILIDRECLSSQDANALTADDVATDYEQRIAPAIDRLEDHLVEEYCAARNAALAADEARMMRGA